MANIYDIKISIEKQIAKGCINNWDQCLTYIEMHLLADMTEFEFNTMRQIIYDWYNKEEVTN